MKNIDQLYSESIKPNLIHKNGNTNHLPMALLSLKSLGASDEHGEEFFEHYLKTLGTFELKNNNRINQKNWKEFLGKGEYFDDYYYFFCSQSEKSHPEEVLATYLTILFESPISAAFHAAIRVGYLIEHQKWEDIPFSLAYWAATFVCIHGAYSSTSEINIADYNFDYLQNFKESEPIKGRNITMRATLAAQTECYNNILKKTSVDDGFELARNFGLSIMEETLDFTALHLITGTYACYIISNYLNSTSKTLVPSLFAIYLSMTNAKRRSTAIPERASVEDVKELGRRSLDDHVIKFCDTAVKEFKNTSNDLYLKLAVAYANKVGS